MGGGWLRPPIFGLVAVFTLAASVLGILRFSTTHSTVSSTAVFVTLVLAVLTIVLVLLLTTFYSFVRRVRLTTDQVEFVVGSRHVRVDWSDVVPPAYPYFLGINFRYRVNGTIQYRDPMFVTRDQARAILSHPARPASWVVAAAVGKSLGLPLSS